METWLRNLIRNVPGPLRGAVTWILTGVIRVFQWSDSLARRLRGGWLTLYSGARGFATGLTAWFVATYITIRWLILIGVPAWARATRDALQRWAAPLIAAARDAARAGLDTLHRWASGILRDLLARLDTLRRWAAGILASVTDRVRRLVERVFGVWATPARLAAWLAGAMWSALWRYGYSQADRIGAALWHRRRAIGLRAVADIERIIGRLL